MIHHLPAGDVTHVSRPGHRRTSCKTGDSQDQVQISCVSHLIEDGTDPLFVQQQVGHSWASTTAVYTTVGADARNRMLKAALARAYQKEGDG